VFLFLIKCIKGVLMIKDARIPRYIRSEDDMGISKLFVVSGHTYIHESKTLMYGQGNDRAIRSGDELHTTKNARSTVNFNAK
jgi:hypothetical protein